MRVCWGFWHTYLRRKEKCKSRIALSNFKPRSPLSPSLIVKETKKGRENNSRLSLLYWRFLSSPSSVSAMLIMTAMNRPAIAGKKYWSAIDEACAG
jgi:hypothetical protein